MSGRAAWVLSPTDGTAHLLGIESSNGALLTTQCRQSLPSGIVQHDRLPSRQPCQECFTVYLLPPDPVFARHTLRLATSRALPHRFGLLVASRHHHHTPAPDTEVSVSKGHGVSGHPATTGLPRWARCLVDAHLHLLTPVEAAAAGIEGHGRAGCGRLIPRAGLTIDSASVAGWCVSCLAVGIAR